VKADLGTTLEPGFVEVDRPTVLAFKLLRKSSLEEEDAHRSRKISMYCLTMNVDKTQAEALA
jgi:hypothetical protein